MKISIVLEALTGTFVTDMDRASKEAKRRAEEVRKAWADSAKQLGVAIGAGAAAAATALGVLTQKAINTADAVGKAAKKTGASAEEISKLKFAAEQSGASLETIEKALARLAKEADMGGESLARLGISATDSNGRMRSAAELFADSAEQISKLGNATERSAAAQALFGKSGAELLPLLISGRDGLAAMGKEAEALGIVFSGATTDAAEQFNDNLSKLQDAAMGLGNTVAQELLPTLLDLSQAAIDFAKGIREDGTLSAWIDGIKEAAQYVDELAVFIATRLVAGALISLGTALVSTAGGFTAAAAAAGVFRGALALVGGPLGLIVTGAATLAVAVYNYESDTQKSKEATDNLKESLDKLNAATGAAIAPAIQLAAQRKAEAIETLKAAGANLQLAIAREKVRASDTRKAGGLDPGFASEARSASERVRELQAEIARTSDLLVEYENDTANAAARIEEFKKQTAAAIAESLRLGPTLKDQAKATKEAADAFKEAAEEAERFDDWNRQVADGAAGARDTLREMANALSADLGGPAEQAWQDYERTLEDVKTQLALIRMEGPATADELALAAKIGDDAWRKLQLTIEEVNYRAGEDARRAAEESARAWEDFSYGLADAVLDGSKGVKSYFKKLLDDLKRELIASGLMNVFRSIFNVGGAGVTGAGSLLGALSGGAGSGGAGAVGSGGILGSLLGGAGSLLGGGLGTGMLASASIFSGAGLIGGITGSIGAGVASIAGGAFMQGVGLLLGPVGLIVGAVAALTQIFGEDQETILRVRSSQFNGDRRARGVEQSDLGSIFVRGESLGDGAAVEIAGRIKDFDNLIAGLLNADQLAAVRDRLSAVNDTFRDGAATVGEALDARFGAILGEFSADVVAFVGTAGELEERVGRLAEALQIEKIVDLGTLGDTFAEVADLLTDYRVGTEEIGATYARLLGSVSLLDEALDLSGTSIDLTREEMIRFAADITAAAGGLERATSLWSAYFETFYTADERAAYALQQARANAATQAADIGLNATDFEGAAGAQAFRALFEAALPTLTAEAIVEWLEFAQALGVVIDMTGEATDAIDQVSGSLSDLMTSVTDQLAEFAPPATFAQQLAAINTETEAMIARATALGATEQQLAQIRELGAARVGAVLADQAAAYGQYADLVRGINDELAAASGMSEFAQSMRDIDRDLASMIASLNAAARAAGMQGAAEADLAAAHQLAAIRAAEAIARLEQSGRDIVQQLYGTQLERLDREIAEMQASAGAATSSWAGGMNEVTQAVDSAVTAQIGAQQRIRDWLDNLMIGDLGGLRPRDALVEAQALFDRTLASALGGDAEAMAALPGLADQLLRLGQRVYASGDPYFDLRDTIRDALTQVAGLAIAEPVGGGGGPGVGVDGGGFGGVNPDLAALIAERDALAAEQATAERRALATELAAVIRDLVIATGRPLDEIAATLGVEMSDLVTDLGVNLDELTVATASQLADIAQATGTELSALAASVGVDLGSLADRQSLLNDALEAEIAALPQGQRDLLEPLLRDVEEAAALGDTAGVEAGIGAMEDAIADLSPDLRDMLAPYFLAITPADPATQLSVLTSVESTLGTSLTELQTQTTILGDILAGIGALSGLQPGPGLGGTGGPGTGPIGIQPPGYAVGTPFVPADGLAYLHRGEAVIPARVNAALRSAGVSGGTSDNLLVAELRELRRERREADEYTRRLESRLEKLESATREGNRMLASATERQTDAIKSRPR
jgi:hypothetical protein